MVAVVTGANGHVGVNLVASLREAGREVVAVDLREPTELLRLGATWVPADVRDEDAMRAVLTGAEVVFHLAAVISVVGPMGGLVESVNVAGVGVTARAALAAGVPRFVHCSSVHAFDLEACEGTDVTEESPRSLRAGLPAYDRSKAAGEARLQRVVADGLDAVVLNPTGILGPRDPGPSRMGAVLLAAARGTLPATVRGSFDWVDVRDVVAALLAAEHAGERGANYLVGGRSASAAELASLAASATGRRAPLVDLPMAFARVWTPLATALARRSLNPLLYTQESLHALQTHPTVDHRRAATALGHEPRALEDTVDDLVRSFVDRGLVGGTGPAAAVRTRRP
jgi:dihydroflavonol-4-reductase